MLDMKVTVRHLNTNFVMMVWFCENIVCFFLFDSLDSIFCYCHYSLQEWLFIYFTRKDLKLHPNLHAVICASVEEYELAAKN